MNRTTTIKGLLVTIALSGVAACADPGTDANTDGKQGDPSTEEPSVSQDELFFGRRPHFNWWLWWWEFHHRHHAVDAGHATDSGVDSGTAVDSGVDSGTVEVDSGTTEADSGTAEVDSGTTEADSGTAEVDSGTTEADSGTAEVDSGTTEVDSGTTEVDSGTPDTGTAEVDSGTTEVDSGTTEIDSGTPDTGTAEVDSGTPDTGTAEVDSGTPDTGTAEVDSGVADSGTATDPCTECRNTNCRNYMGVDLVHGCFEAVDAEFGADAADPSFIQDCTNVVTCARANACAYSDSKQAAGCYCGSASIDTCAASGPAADAPCVPQWQAATRTTVNADVQVRFTDLSFPAGWAYFLLDSDRVSCSVCTTP